MKDIKDINDQNLQEVSGGINRVNGPIKVTCPNCHSAEHTYVVRIRKGSRGESIKTYHCDTCNKDFEPSSGNAPVERTPSGIKNII